MGGRVFEGRRQWVAEIALAVVAQKVLCEDRMLELRTE